MATTLAGVSLSPTRINVTKADSTKTHIHNIKPQCLNYKPWRVNHFKGAGGGGRIHIQIRTMATAPDGISEKVTESIKNAKEVCADDPVGGECAAAWDEVEEVSAAASDARLKKKESDPLETYCKDNPETEQCRTYED